MDHESQFIDVNLSILHFLWVWKVSTTAGLHQKFSPECSGHGFYSRLWRLEKKSLIQVRAGDNPKNSFWTLTKAGFNVIRKHLPLLLEDGYQSEYLEHDLLVSAIHLGDGLFEKIDGLEFFTEQQLRRYDPDCYPKWVPPCLGHRPDGYWRTMNSNGPKTIALEVELNQKPDREYASAAHFYNDMTNIDRVLWITKRPSVAENIHRCVLSAIDDGSKHNYVSLGPIYRSGWESTIELGADIGKSISTLLANPARMSREHVFTRFSLDPRKTPYRSNRSRLLRLTGFSY